MPLRFSGGGVVAMAHTHNWCEHGRELAGVSAGRHEGHWQLWGDYPCPYCEHVLLASVRAQSFEVLVAGRRLPVHQAHE